MLNIRLLLFFPFLILNLNLYGQTTAFISARKGQSVQVIDTNTDALTSTIGTISTNANWRNNERTIGISSDNNNKELAFCTVVFQFVVKEYMFYFLVVKNN